MRYLHRPFAYRALPVVANSDNDNQGSQSHDYCTPPFSPIRTVIMYICFRKLCTDDFFSEVYADQCK